METETREADVVILGSGSAGLTARRAAKKAGASVLVVDPGPFGTTCARVGCMPSKLLIAAADAAHSMRSGEPFGVRAEGVTIDGPAVFERLRRERDRFVGSVTKAIDAFEADGELLVGRGQIVGPGRLLVEGVEVRFGALVVATGTTAFVPPPFRELTSLTNETVFELEDVPESLLVIGLGVIGLELGQALHRLGARTTILGVGGKIGPIRDPEIRAEARAVLASELDLHPEYELRSIEADGDGVHIRFVDSLGTERDERFEKVLMAAGRRTSLGALGLDTLGIEPGPDGRYPIDEDTLQLADAPVFVAGDANGLHPLLHEAADDGHLAGANATRFPEVRAVRRRTPLAIAFTHPQIGIVGGGYPRACALEAVAGSVDFANQGRARVQDTNRGKLRVYGDPHTGRVVGAEMFGPQVEHLAHLVAWIVQCGLTVEEAVALPYYHPVVEEGLRSALHDLAANMRHGAPIRCKVSELGVGA